MAIVYSEKVIEIAVVQSYANRPAVNVWHMFHDQELTGPDKQGVVRDFANNWQDHMMDNISNAVSLVRFDWRSLDPNDGTVGTLAPDGAKPTQGGSSGASMPPNVAYLVKKNTSSRPRGRRDGRSFLPGVLEAAVDAAGVISSTERSAWAADLVDFYNGISDTGTVIGGWNGDSYPVVLETTKASRTKSTLPVTIGSRRVTSITLDPLVSTQRDRLR